ncbi:MAG TPA: Hsp20 family protein [Thermoanaerobaculia bacterium]|nr:Hsp20 family protein [Thermoanaerobaculia bacterium]
MSRKVSRLLVGSDLRGELERLVQEILAASHDLPEPGAWTPPIDVLESQGSLLVVLEVPGLGAADLRVEVEGRTLRVRGRRRLSFADGREVRFHCLERQEGQFVRQLEVLQPVDFGAARATLCHGLLVLELPKIEDRRRRTRVLEVSERDEEDSG